MFAVGGQNRHPSGALRSSCPCPAGSAGRDAPEEPLYAGCPSRVPPGIFRRAPGSPLGPGPLRRLPARNSAGFSPPARGHRTRSGQCRMSTTIAPFTAQAILAEQQAAPERSHKLLRPRCQYELRPVMKSGGLPGGGSRSHHTTFRHRLDTIRSGCRLGPGRVRQFPAGLHSGRPVNSGKRRNSAVVFFSGRPRKKDPANGDGRRTFTVRARPRTSP